MQADRQTNSQGHTLYDDDTHTRAHQRREEARSPSHSLMGSDPPSLADGRSSSVSACVSASFFRVESLIYLDPLIVKYKSYPS